MWFLRRNRAGKMAQYVEVLVANPREPAQTLGTCGGWTELTLRSSPLISPPRRIYTLKKQM